MIKNYLLITWRSMMKNKLFIFINMFGIAIAIASCIVAYLNWSFDHEWDSHHVNADKIYRVQFWHDFQGQKNRHGTAPMAMANHIQQNFSDVDEVIRFITRWGNFRVGTEIFSTRLSYVDSAFFETFTFEMLQGNPKDIGDKSRIFISDEIAKKYFDKEDVVGYPLTQIIDNHPVEFVIGGVFRKPPLNSSFSSEAITSFANYWEVVKNEPDQTENSWRAWNTLFLTINDPSRVAYVEEQLQHFVEPQNKAREDFKVERFYLENFSGMTSRNSEAPQLQSDWLREGMPNEAVLVPTIMSMLLLLLACFNFTNTSIAVSSRRLKEIGVRKVMGGLRQQLILQFLGENLILCFFGLLLGLMLAEWMVPAYSSLWSWLDLKLNYTENAGFLLFLGALLFVTALIAGGYPAFYITSFEPVSILKGKQKFGGTNWFTRVLLGFQFAISLLAIIFSVAFYRNAQYQKEYDFGYATTGIISAWIGKESEFNTYRDALSENKDILTIAGTRHHISNSWYNNPVKYESTEREVDIMDIGDNYMEAMNMKLVAGRGFQKDSQTDLKESILVTEEFVKSFGWEGDPIGKRIVWMDTLQLYVIGVVKDVYARALWDPVNPMMIRYTSPDRYQQMVVSMAPENIKSINEFMEKKWKEVFPNYVYNGQMVDQRMASTLEINTNIVKTFSFLGFFAILLSASGLYTLVSLNIIKKLKEIGVRKVLGASAANIVRVINIEFIIILSIASVCGGALGYYATSFLMDSIWEYYKDLDVVAFALCVAIMFLISALAVSVKTISTASLNPVKTLRDE